jgi:phosphoesterase RecJ-like protein
MPQVMDLSAQRSALQNSLNNAKTVLITAHIGPDADGIGSMLALKQAILAQWAGHVVQVDCVTTGKVPDFLRFLPGFDTVLNLDVTSAPLSRYDVAIAVDCGSAERLGRGKHLFTSASVNINLDHHVSNDQYGHINLMETDAASTGQVVANWLDAIGIGFTADMATCLYATLIADTGGFKYSNTSPAALRLAARLVEAGADPEAIYKHLLDTKPWRQIQLHAEALMACEFNPPQTLGWLTVTREQLAKYNALDEHLEGLVETVRQVDTVVLAAIFKETKEGGTKISLRSDDHRINVAEILVRFGGGGHKMAAGCSLSEPLDSVKAKLLPILEQTVATYHLA